MIKRKLLRRMECYLMAGMIVVGFSGGRAMALDDDPVRHGSKEDGYICKHGYHTFGDYYLKVGNKRTGSKPCFISADFPDRYELRTHRQSMCGITRLKIRESAGIYD